MGDLESAGGPPVSEAGLRDSEFSRSRLGVGVRRGWSTPQSEKKRYQPTGVRGSGTCTVGTGGRFTNAVVLKFDGNGCWQQHLQIFNSIAKSNGWVDETVALQLFAHLEGEALNVALLMSEGKRANREGLSQGFSNYYNSPGKLAGFRRKFESVTRRAGADPTTIAMELEILAVRGFGDMGTRARNQMVRDRFIAAPPRQCPSGYADPGDS